MKVYIIRWEQSESGWGNADFDTEVFTNKQIAEDRFKHLEKSRSEYCGYYFIMETAILDEKDASYK